MTQRMTKSVTIALVIVMIIALGGWILQWQLADDETAEAESCGLAASMLERGTTEGGAPLSDADRARITAELANCDTNLP